MVDVRCWVKGTRGVFDGREGRDITKVLRCRRFYGPLFSPLLFSALIKWKEIYHLFGLYMSFGLYPAVYVCLRGRWLKFSLSTRASWRARVKWRRQLSTSGVRTVPVPSSWTGDEAPSFCINSTNTPYSVMFICYLLSKKNVFSVKRTQLSIRKSGSRSFFLLFCSRITLVSIQYSTAKDH